jgi:hypothetical protein
MTINELIELTKSSKNRMLKQDQLCEMLKKTLAVKKYIGIRQKKDLVDEIVNDCILYEDGVFKFDDIDKYICFTIRVIGAYTNLDMSGNNEDDYDMLCESGILDSIINTFKKEYDDVNILLQMRCDYILSGNSIEAQLGRFLEGVSDKLDGIATALSNKIDSIDMSNLPFKSEDIGKLMKFIGLAK